jgi:hypothetical protein
MLLVIALAYSSTSYLLYIPTVLMGEDSCADGAGRELADHLKVTAVLTVLLVKCSYRSHG